MLLYRVILMVAIRLGYGIEGYDDLCQFLRTTDKGARGSTAEVRELHVLS